MSAVSKNLSKRWYNWTSEQMISDRDVQNRLKQHTSHSK